MTTRHHADHEEILQRILCGDLALAEPEARGLLERCEVCRVELAELQQALSSARGSVQRDQELIEDSLRSATDDDRKAVNAALNHLATASHSVQVGRGGPSPMAWAAVFLALLLTGTLYWYSGVLRRSQELVPQHVLLGDEQPECLSPEGAVESVTGFTWKGELPQDCSFQIEVYSGSMDESLVPTQRASSLTGNAWTPSPEFLRDLPQEFDWRIVVVDVGHSELGSDVAHCVLSP